MSDFRHQFLTFVFAFRDMEKHVHQHEARVVHLRKILFRYRSYTPLPFLAVMLFFANPTWGGIIPGAALLLVGEFWRFWGVAYAGSETRTTDGVGASKLVTSGAFAHVRNPLYVGNVCIYIGVGIMSQALTPWLPLAALVYFVFQYTLIIREEEDFLRRTFGAEYEEFCRNVPRLLIRIVPYASPHPVAPNWRAAWKSETRTLQGLGVVLILLFLVGWLR
jgi:protein-S-isoprenylcysteine O-methyltransferase Ste14